MSKKVLNIRSWSIQFEGIIFWELDEECLQLGQGPAGAGHRVSVGEAGAVMI